MTKKYSLKLNIEFISRVMKLFLLFTLAEFQGIENENLHVQPQPFDSFA